MKKYKILLVILMSISFSCKKDFLNQVPNDRLTLAAAFGNQKNAEAFLANTYSYLPDESNQANAPAGNAGVWTGGCTEADFDEAGIPSQDINDGAYDASNGLSYAYWDGFYQGIRSATVFIANVDKVPNLSVNLKAQYKAEARALRGIYYFYLLRIYGPVVILDDQPIAPDAPLSNYQLPRSPFDDCVTYVTAELDAAAKSLPAKTSNNDNIGRLTSGFAQAIKSELLLYAASPLFNGNTDYKALINKDGTHLISQTYNAAKWAIAATAAKSFIDTYVPNTYDLYRENDENGNYSPFLSCRNVMLADWNQEIIFENTTANVTAWQHYTTPYHEGYPTEIRGSGGLGATQEMVDAFFMANGKPINSVGSGYIKTGQQYYIAPNQDFPTNTFNQWINREPRFYADITYNNSEWLDKNAGLFTTTTTYSGNSGIKAGKSDYSHTGYIVRKNNPPSDAAQGNRSWVMMRLAEIYLNYAEALNESDPGNPDILKYINLIRNRAGIPGYGSGVDEPVGQDAVRQAIRHERQVELAFESNRFFDVRRWKIAEQTESGPMHGLNIYADEPDFYTVVTFENRVFTKRNYLFPIPQGDVNADSKLVQNTGY